MNGLPIQGGTRLVTTQVLLSFPVANSATVSANATCSQVGCSANQQAYNPTPCNTAATIRALSSQATFNINISSAGNYTNNSCGDGITQHDLRLDRSIALVDSVTGSIVASNNNTTVIGSINCTNKSGSGSLVTTVAVTGLVPGRLYYIRLFANAAGNGTSNGNSNFNFCVTSNSNNSTLTFN